MLKYLVIVGAIVQLWGVFWYIKETLHGETKPNKVTWLMWSVAPFIATAAAVSDGVSWAVFPVFMSGFGPFMIFISSFVNKKSYWKLGRFDYLCGFCSVLALIFWGITKEPNIAIGFAIISDGFAAIPTLIKCWKYPETETAAAFSTGLFSSLTSFAAIKAWGFSEYAFPVYLVVINSSLLLSVFKRKIMLGFK